jgi:hypothetical protein
MLTLLVGISLVAGIGFGWYGHKAKLRIDIWGRNELEQDLIFQVAEGTNWNRMADGGTPLAPFPASHVSH